MTLVNVWASWCVPCHDEAPLLMQLAAGQAHPHRRHQLQGPAGQRAPLPRPLRQSVRGGRRRRQRPRLDRLGRLRRAGNLRGRSRRPHRLQAGRADHAGESRSGAQAADREGAGALRTERYARSCLQLAGIGCGHRSGAPVCPCSAQTYEEERNAEQATRDARQAVGVCRATNGTTRLDRCAHGTGSRSGMQLGDEPRDRDGLAISSRDSL